MPVFYGPDATSGPYFRSIKTPSPGPTLRVWDASRMDRVICAPTFFRKIHLSRVNRDLICDFVQKSYRSSLTQISSDGRERPGLNLGGGRGLATGKPEGEGDTHPPRRFHFFACHLISSNSISNVRSFPASGWFASRVTVDSDTSMTVTGMVFPWSRPICRTCPT